MEGSTVPVGVRVLTAALTATAAVCYANSQYSGAQQPPPPPKRGCKEEAKLRPESEYGALKARRLRLKQRQQQQKQWKGYLKRLPGATGSSAHASVVAEEVQVKEHGCTPASRAAAELVVTQRKQRKERKRQDVGLPLAKRCAFPIKHRTCSRPRLEGSRFCLTHRGADESQHTSRARAPAALGTSKGAKERVCCELCGASMWSDRVRAHAPRCNAAKQRKAQQELSCWVPGVNSGPAPPAPGGGTEVRPKDSVRSLCLRVQRAYSRHVALADMTPSHAADQGSTIKSDVLLQLAAQRSATAEDVVTQKHLQQQSLILGHMRDRGLLVDSGDQKVQSVQRRTYVEFGAGKGMMSLGVNAEAPGADLLLVERDSSSTRTNADRVLRKRTGLGGFERLRIDIRDLDLAQYNPQYAEAKMQPSSDPQATAVRVGTATNFREPVVAISKHLCGVATDLTLRCLANYQHQFRHQQSADTGGDSDSVRCLPCSAQPGVNGIAIALCCHGLCEWQDYVGRDFWINELQFSAEDFERVKRFSSWATGARRKAADEAAAMVAAPAAAAVPQVELRGAERVDEAVASDRLLEAWEMVEFGRQCKRLIDAGRLHYVRQELPHLAAGASLVTYCDEEITPENCLLIAAEQLAPNETQ